jgi:uncharacterized protein YjiS (DUF1127 family)
MKAQTRPAFSSSGTGLASIGSLLRRTMRHWNDRRALTALSELDDYLLADIGLTRSDLDWALHQPSSALPSEELTRLVHERRERRNRRVI